MPCLTTYNLEMKGHNPPTIQQVALKLSKSARPTFHEGHYGENEQHILWEKTLEGDSPSDWYNHQEDMAKISMNRPHVLFQLTGRGEDSAGDNWREYYLGGKVQQVFGEMTYPEFEADKLTFPEVVDDSDEKEEQDE